MNKLLLFFALLLVLVMTSPLDDFAKFQSCLNDCDSEIQLCKDNKACFEVLAQCKDEWKNYADCLARSNSLFASKVVKCFTLKCLPRFG